MRPQNSKPARAHGLPKIHKRYDNLPKFRPIVDTTGTSHYKVGEYLTNLLYPLTVNEFTFKDSFDAVSKIQNIPHELLKNGYRFVSFDVESLFTNVPLNRTLNIICRRVFDEKRIETTLEKRTLRKLIKDTCTKTAFSCNNVLYEQCDGVSMGSSLGPVLANLIMTELEEKVVRPLVAKGTLKFYGRYVDDTLLVIKPKDVKNVHKAFEKFDKNLKFTVDEFVNETPHFLDIDMLDDEFQVYRKATNTGLYVNYDSFVPWHNRISWLRSLVVRATRICSPTRLPAELKKIKQMASWNGFPKYLVNSLMKRFIQNLSTVRQSAETEPVVESVVIWFNMPYLGNRSLSIFQTCVKKIKRNLNLEGKKIIFKQRFKTTKISYLCNTKDRSPLLTSSNVVYEFKCPGCSSNYIGKCDRTLFERSREHATVKGSAVYRHLIKCEGIHFLDSLLMIDVTEPLTDDEIRDKRINYVRNNIRVVDKSDNWSVLLFKEALSIKDSNPQMNSGLKASRDLNLFR